MLIKKQGLWPQNTNSPDSYAAFRGHFQTVSKTVVKINYLCAHWCRIWVDGRLTAQGPARYNRQFPEYETLELELKPGRHVIAAIAVYPGVDTRMLEKIPPFWFCQIADVDIDWKCMPLEAFKKCVRRINPQLGWIEWCDTRQIPAGWNKPDFDDSRWPKPRSVVPDTGDFMPLCSAAAKLINHRLAPMAQGVLADVFSYDKDDPPTRFFLRDMQCGHIPADGIWRRYDLGRVRLGSPCFILDVPVGTVVEFGYAEYLTSGRVAPYINCSDGLSANMDRYIAAGGRQEFAPITPKGGRFLEVHIFAKKSEIVFCEESFLERTHYDKAEGGFECSDGLLNRIWNMGIETFRACSEDAVTDNPTRERGQWTGDVVSVGMEIGAAGFRDLSLFRRALMQAAQSRKASGLVAGMSPGASIYVSSFAAQWVSACMRYYRITGDKKILADNYSYALDNLKVFEDALTGSGLSRSIDWAFIDWGYQISPDAPDIAMDCHYLAALKNASEWSTSLGDANEAEKYTSLAKRVSAIIEQNICRALKSGWDTLGYHSAVLAGSLGFFTGSQLHDCVEYVKSHILNCFPENPDALRLGSPTLKTKNVITPYFSHFAFDFLINNGQMDFVLQRYRNCWGWGISKGLTTLPEVFDLRWSHCHQWSGCPTWQLSQYCLGLKHCFDKGANNFDFVLKSSSLKSVKGRIPFGTDGQIDIQWQKEGNKIRYSLKSNRPITISSLPQYQANDITSLDILL